MNYAQNTLLNKRLPSFLGFFVLLVALAVTIVLSKNSLSFVSKATTSAEPKNLHVSNISSTSFTISYTTDSSAVGTISYGNDPTTPNIALDDRDQLANKPTEHHVHFITIKNLTRSTKYYYVIDSGNQKTDKSGSPFTITTAASDQNQTTRQPTLSGTVALSDGSIPEEGIVYVSTDNSQQLAALLNQDGSYQIPLDQLMTTSLNAPASLTPNTLLQIQVLSQAQQSIITVPVSKANQVPKIVLSQSYDFTLETIPSSESAQTASEAGFPTFAPQTASSSPQITTPTDSQGFKDQQPLFQGRALPNAEVEITIKSQQEIATKVQSDSAGSWQFRPSTALAPGKHTITIKSLDASGIMQTITKSFIVYAQGSQFVEPSVSPVATPTVAPTTVPTTAPTAAPSPTTMPTLLPTPTPTVSKNVTVSPTQGPLPPTGSTALVSGIVFGASVLGIGALLFFLSVV